MLTTVPSTDTDTVPVGVVVLDDELEATAIVMASVVPGATVLFAGVTVVVDATKDHAVSRLLKSMEPRPVARS